MRARVRVKFCEACCHLVFLKQVARNNLHSTIAYLNPFLEKSEQNLQEFIIFILRFLFFKQIFEKKLVLIWPFLNCYGQIGPFYFFWTWQPCCEGYLACRLSVWTFFCTNILRLVHSPWSFVYIHIYAHTRFHSLLYSLSHALSHTLILSPFLSHTHTFKNTCSHTLSLHTHTFIHSYAHSIWFSHTRTFTHTYAFSLSLTLSVSHTHTLLHTHTDNFFHSHTCSLTRISRSESYKRNFALKKSQLVFYSLKVCYFNLDHNNPFV